jgi:hypothetical protein
MLFRLTGAGLQKELGSALAATERRTIEEATYGPGAMKSAIQFGVIAGLDPAIHFLAKRMEPRVKPR